MFMPGESHPSGWAEGKRGARALPGSLCFFLSTGLLASMVQVGLECQGTVGLALVRKDSPWHRHGNHLSTQGLSNQGQCPFPARCLLSPKPRTLISPWWGRACCQGLLWALTVVLTSLANTEHINLLNTPTLKLFSPDPTTTTEAKVSCSKL